MSAVDRFDRDLEAWLAAEAPPVAPDGLHEAAIGRVRAARQWPRWVAVVRGAGPGVWPQRFLPSMTRVGYSLLVIVALLVALLVAAIVGGQRTSTISNGFIAFAAWDWNPRYNAMGDRDIYLVSLEGPARRIIGSATDGLDQICPAFSADGRRLAFGQARDAGVDGTPFETSFLDATLEVVDLDAGGNPSHLQSIELGATLPPPCANWSPDGQRLAFSVPLTSPINPERSATGSAVWIVTLADGRVTVLPDLLATDLEWSPDGTQLAVASGRDARIDGEVLQDGVIYLYSIGTGKLRSLPETLGTTQFTLSPDGQRIAYGATDATGDAEIRVIDVATGRVDVLATGFGAWLGPQPGWSPSGDRIAYTRGWDCSECNAVVLVAAHRGADTGSRASEIMTVPGGSPEEGSATDRTRFWSARRATWSPAGDFLLYVAEPAVSGRFHSALVAVPVDPRRPAVVLVDDLSGDLLVSWEDSDSQVPIQSWGRQPSG